MRYRLGDRIIITERSHCAEEGVIIEPGCTGVIDAEEINARGVISVKMDYDEYQMDRGGGGYRSLWGPFSLIISKSRIKIDTKRNRDNKIDTLLEDA